MQAPVQSQQPSLFANMASTAAGVAVGSTIGHTLGHGLTSMFGGSSQPAQAPQQAQQYDQQSQMERNPCEADQKAFMGCLEKNSNDIAPCQFYLDMFKQCQANYKTY
jgi:hypothetical protein